MYYYVIEFKKLLMGYALVYEFNSFIEEKGLNGTPQIKILFLLLKHLPT